MNHIPAINNLNTYLGQTSTKPEKLKVYVFETTKYIGHTSSPRPLNSQFILIHSPSNKVLASRNSI